VALVSISLTLIRQGSTGLTRVKTRTVPARRTFSPVDEWNTLPLKGKNAVDLTTCAPAWVVTTRLRTSPKAKARGRKARGGELCAHTFFLFGKFPPHIHCALVGVNGPVVVFLAGLHAAGLDIDGKWVSNATITNTSIVNTLCGATVAALAESMRNRNTYVNVHSVAHPGGEVRGQVESAD